MAMCSGLILSCGVMQTYVSVLEDSSFVNGLVRELEIYIVAY